MSVEFDGIANDTYYFLGNSQAEWGFVSGTDAGIWVIDWQQRREGTFDLTLTPWPDDGGIISRLDCAGAFVPSPAQANLVYDTMNSSLAVLAYPALNRPCSRRGLFRLQNGGDRVLQVSSVGIDGGSAWSTQFDSCSDAGIGWSAGGDSCSFRVCFNGAPSGVHQATVEVHTSLGLVTAPVEVTVAAPWSNLDPAFADAGVADLYSFVSIPFGYYEQPPPRAAAAFGGGLAVVDPPSGLRLLGLGDGGGLSRGNQVPELPGAPFGQWYFLAGGLDGGRMYATFNSISNLWYVLALRPDLTLDPLFADAGWLETTGTQVGGRYVASRDDGTLYLSDTSSVRALTAAGDPVPGYGNVQGVSVLAEPTNGELLCTARGDLAVSSNPQSVALLDGATGALKATYSPLVSAQLGTTSTGQLIASGFGVVTLGDAGVTSLFDPMTQVVDLAVDAQGRVLLAVDGGVTRMSLAGVADGSWLLPGVVFVRCPPAGGCYAVGTTGIESYAVRLAP